MDDIVSRCRMPLDVGRHPMSIMRNQHAMFGFAESTAASTTRKATQPSRTAQEWSKQLQGALGNLGLHVPL